MKRIFSLLFLLALTACGGTHYVSAGAVPTTCQTRGTGIFSLPDPGCTPGALNPAVTQATIHSTICVAGYTKTIRPPVSVTGPEKLAEMKAYGITGPTSSVELDHFIPLELGGAANKYTNYWPEPDYPSHGFYLNPKDPLENLLRKMVCSGTMTLVAAQNDMTNNWIIIYHKYFGK